MNETQAGTSTTRTDCSGFSLFPPDVNLSVLSFYGASLRAAEKFLGHN
jgi:hypothetical protein